jgi:hypothetical protein
VGDRFHGNEIHNALHLVLDPDWQLDQSRVVAQLLAQLTGHFLGVAARPIELVDECQARNPVPLHLAVYRQRLALQAERGKGALSGFTASGPGEGFYKITYLHAADAAENKDGAVQHTKRSLDLHREVHVACGGRRG